VWILQIITNNKNNAFLIDAKPIYELNKRFEKKARIGTKLGNVFM